MKKISGYFLMAALMCAFLIPSALANMDHMNKGDIQGMIQTLNQASSELRASDPTLADKLQSMAQQKQQWLDQKKEKENKQ